jgi:hypothetical protein
MNKLSTVEKADILDRIYQLHVIRKLPMKQCLEGLKLQKSRFYTLRKELYGMLNEEHQSFRKNQVSALIATKHRAQSKLYVQWQEVEESYIAERAKSEPSIPLLFSYRAEMRAIAKDINSYEDDLFEQLNPHGPEIAVLQQLNVINPQNVIQDAIKHALSLPTGSSAEANP